MSTLRAFWILVKLSRWWHPRSWVHILTLAWHLWQLRRLRRGI